MATFTVKGPFELPVAKLNAGRHISETQAREFWSRHKAIASERGCYVFAFRTPRALVPVYVGKATRSFKQEVFAPHKLNKYNHGLAAWGKGTPMLFFICLPKNRGRVNAKAISEAESFLIQAGLLANRRLLNKLGVGLESWSIAGVVHSQVGRPSESAKALRTCLKL